MLQPNELALLKENQISILQKLLTGTENLTKQAETETSFISMVQGYYYNLQEIYLDKSYPDDLRWIAAITFKNGIYRYWKRPINIQYNLAIATIVKTDFPKFWPTAFNDLVEAVESAKNSTDISTKVFRENNILNVLHLCIKNTCALALPMKRSAFREFSAQFVPKLSLWYQECCFYFFEQQKFSTDFLQKLLVFIKISRRVLCFGMTNPHLDESANKLFTLITETLQNIFTLYASMNITDCDVDFAKAALKVIFSIGKFFLDFIKYNPSSFIAMNNSEKTIQWYGSILVTQEFDNSHIGFKQNYDHNSELDFSRFYLQALLIYKSLTKNLSFQEDTYESKLDEGYSAFLSILKSNILTHDFVNQLTGSLINKYMVLTEADLAQWEESPQDWINTEESDHWEIDSRICAEKLFYDLFTEYKDFILPPLLSLLSSSDKCAIEQKDAIYTSIGLCANDFGKMVNFGEWLETHLIKDISLTSPRSEIIRRRVVWLIGKWVSLGQVSEKKHLLYEILSKTVSSSEPCLVVRLTSVISLKECLNDWDFSPETFIPYSGIIIEQLISLFQSVNDDECKSLTLNCISCIIERLRSSALIHRNIIFEFATWLWSQTVSHQNNINFKNPIILISTLMFINNAVNSFEGESKIFHPLAKDIIDFSCNPNSSEHIYLLEYGTELWASILNQTNDLSIDIAQLFELLCTILNSEITEFITEHLRILENYFLLGISKILLDGFEKGFNTLEKKDESFINSSVTNPHLNLILDGLVGILETNTGNLDIVRPVMNTVDLLIAYSFNASVWLDYSELAKDMGDSDVEYKYLEDESSDEIELFVDSAGTKRKAYFLELDTINPNQVFKYIKNSLASYEASVGHQLFYSKVMPTSDSDPVVLFIRSIDDRN
ncbi:hypothetical protein BB561_002960 [Smittium simulii]|uniref:Importin N-terminal domain-containing protein n=1 Tax=Smittium simulii TaxID=133385 RepID=A0A2T9YNI9_9FUNG|nr:hypothetical protein BB561_002960 [Smittium simulii]